MAKIEEIEENEQPQTVKKLMTDEERLALATKLDGELDDFINGLERRGYTEGWPEDRWEEVSIEFETRLICFSIAIIFSLGSKLYLRKWTSIRSS